MLVCGPEWNAAINSWVAENGGGWAAPTTYQALGHFIPREGLVGGLVFTEANPVNCKVNIALGPGWNHYPLIRSGFFYAFGQLALRRLTFLISPANMGSIRLVTGLGAVHEATLREAEPEGDLHIYALFAESSPTWSRLCGQKRRRTA